MLERLLASIRHYWEDFITALPRLGLALVIVVVGFLVAGWIGRFSQSRLSSRAHDPLMGRFLGKTLRAVIIIAVVMLGLHAAGLSGIAGAILATAGASAIVIGFAFKDIAENFIAGIILAFNRPFHIEDTIQIDQTFGKVKDMQFRYTQIKTFDGRDVYIPNSDILKKPVINFTGDGFYRLEFIVGIAYESSIEKAMGIIHDVLQKQPDIVHDDTHVNFVAENELSPSTVDLKVFFWVTTDDYRRGALETRGKIIRAVKERLEEAGIYLPCDIREIKTYEPAKAVVLRTEAARDGQAAGHPQGPGGSQNPAAA